MKNTKIKNKGTNRPVDIKRNAAFSMDIGALGDKSALDSMMTIDSRLHLISKNGVYQLQLADQIDPTRKHLNVPNTQQRILNYGSDDEIVAKLLLTGRELLSEQKLQKTVDVEAAKIQLLSLVQDLIAMREIYQSIQKQEDEHLETLKEQKTSGSIALPSTASLNADVKSFVQKTDHAREAILSISKAFCEFKNNKVSTLTELLKKENQDKYLELINFLDSIDPIFSFIRNLRHCIEHPDNVKHLEIKDFHINEDGIINYPSIKIFHPEVPQDKTSITPFMKDVIDRLSNIGELLMAHFCSAYANNDNLLFFAVVEIPESKRQNKFIRFGYEIYFNKSLNI